MPKSTGAREAKRRQIWDWIHAAVASNTDECADWPFGGRVREYGRITYQGTKRLTTHVVLELSGRPRPAAPDNRALHSCDRPSCCNPRHLRWGSMSSNCTDRDGQGHGRVPNQRGDVHSQAKLTEVAVRSIRERVAAGESQRVLAAEYGVRPSAISRAVTGARWGHVV
ncbi:hypothetical protein ACFY0G_02290 [Streptomyces sp. NPDC001552]|uniref:hypothetical protein n=1 Tax=Streptomyces sp. NPDC001552 TaxID=3364587 RepID=UPI003676F6FD